MVIIVIAQYEGVQMHIQLAYICTQLNESVYQLASDYLLMFTSEIQATWMHQILCEDLQICYYGDI